MATPTKNKPTQPAESTGGYGYGKNGKRNLWKWVIIYVIAGGLLYLLIWWLFFRQAATPIY
jgi:cytoskeletal protein RodZ